MVLKNARIVDDSFHLADVDIAVDSDKISQLAPGLSGGEELDLAGCTIVPGFVDIHIHACVGSDTCDADADGIAKMCAHLVTKGVTSFCPTTMTVSRDRITKALAVVKGCMENPPKGAAIVGINMEGPYISANKKGAQSSEFIKSLDFDEFEKYFDACGGIIKIVDIAPECGNAEEFIQKASKLCTVSIAHTEADYACAKRAFDLGITHVTHLFNAMAGFSHREPGVVGAAFDDERVRAEIICDGFHIHPAALRVAFQILGKNRAVIVSDSMRAAGEPDGSYDLGGQMVYVKNGQARLKDGTIAGSTTNMHQEIKNLVSYGIPFLHVIQAATLNPAKEIHEDDKIGSIKVGKYADLVALDSDLNIKMVVARGKVEFIHQ